MILKLQLYFCIISTLFLVGCDKDDIKKREAEALSSFGGKVTFENAEFTYDKKGSLAIWFTHYVKDSDISLDFNFINIDPNEGIIKLVYHKIGGGLVIGKPSSYMHVTLDEDQQGETFVIDSTETLESTLFIESITKNKIAGEFQLYYDLPNNSGPRLADWIPNKFSLTEGVFDARD